jgi:glutamine phosphoribosylpyrophosphate amidotransferase
MDIYSKYMRGNMIIQTDNGFVAIKDKTGRAPLFAAIHPESGLFMVSSENCSESIFNGQVSDDNDASFKDALDIDGKVFKEVEPGTMIRAENGNVRIFHSEDVNPLVTPHELVYTMHPASTFKEKHVGYWREKIGERIADTYKDQMKGYEVVFPIPDSPRHMAKGIWNRMKAYGLDFDEYLFPIDRSTSGLKQLRRMDSKESMKFDKLGIPDIVRGKKVIITEDSLLTSKSLLGTVAQLEAHGADGYCFVTGQPPIIDESQIGIKSSKKYLVSREVMFGVKDIREANERMTAYFAKTFPNIKILYNTVESLAKALDVREDQIWAPRRVRMPLISK